MGGCGNSVINVFLLVVGQTVEESLDLEVHWKFVVYLKRKSLE